MAPKLADIKSESWLDLTKEQPIKRPKWLLRRAQTQVPESSSSSGSLSASSDSSGVTWPSGGKNEAKLTGHNGDIKKQSCDTKQQRGDIQDSKNDYRRHQRRLSSQQAPSSSATTGSSCSLQTSSQDHLLIRIRQESFRSSRRRSSLSDVNANRRDITSKLTTTTTTTTTKMALQSIQDPQRHQRQSLEHSLHMPDKSIAETMSDDDANAIANSHDTLNYQLVSESEDQVLCKRQQQQVSCANITRLQRFKSRLEQRSKRSNSLFRVCPSGESVRNVDQNGLCNQSEREDKSLFSQRSFSSLGDKFGHHLRRSWRKFISNSTQSINQKGLNQHLPRLIPAKPSSVKSKIFPRDGKDYALPEDATDPINKLMLTERWLANHHHLERPRSLQIELSSENHDYLEKRGSNNFIIGLQGSIGRDSSSSTTLVDSITHQANQISVSSKQNYNTEERHDTQNNVSNRSLVIHDGQQLITRASSLGPAITQFRNKSSQYNKQVNKRELLLQLKKIPILVEDKFASLKTDTEGSPTTTATTTSSCRTGTSDSCSSKSNLLFVKEKKRYKHELKSQVIMQNQHQHQHHHNHNKRDYQLARASQPSNTNEAIQEAAHHKHAPILSFAPEDYYLEADEPDTFEESQDSEKQHQLLPGHWPHSTPTQNLVGGQRGHSVEAQLSTGGSSSLERSQAPTSQLHTKQTMMLMQQQHQHQQLLLLPITQPASLMNANFTINQQHESQDNCMFSDPDYDDYAIPSDENFCRLDRRQVELVQMIGEGQKGFVFLGKLQSRDGRQIIDVAIKTLKYETESMIEKLMHEAAMMRQFEHPHIIRFIGVCPETPALIAMELAKLGELRHYLRSNENLISVSQLVLFTFQISTALSYLESKQFVHRDVAARNVLVCSHTCVKLADFGLSRNLQMEPPGCQFIASNQAQLANSRTRNNSRSQSQLNNLLMTQHQRHQQLLLEPDDKSGHYVACSPGKLPVRWLAPESLAFRRFTSASDVWMFAVCTWEMFYLGQLRPWPHIANNEVLSAIGTGQRLTRPPACPSRLYQLMLQCWSFAPVQRPKFRDIKQELWSIYLAERTREQILLDEVGREKQEQCQHLLAMESAARCQQQQSALEQAHQRRMRHILQQQQQLARHQLNSSQKHKLSFANVSPEGAILGQEASLSSSSTSSSLARKRRQLLKASAGNANSQSVPNQQATSTTPNSPSPTQMHNTRKEFQDKFDNDNSTSHRQKRRNQLQKQRSHGSIIGLASNQVARKINGVDNLVENPIDNIDCDLPLSQNCPQRLRHRDDQALLELTKSNRSELSNEDESKVRQFALGYSERLLQFPPKPKSEPKSLGEESSGQADDVCLAVCQAAHYEGLASRRAELDKQMQDLSQEFDQVIQLSEQPNESYQKQHRNHLSAAQKREMDQRNRLDLHRRLLGHIRPASSASSNRARDRANRNSLNLSSQTQSTATNMSNVREAKNRLDPQAHHNLNRPLPHPPSLSQATRVESVDQSLEILASLISPKSDNLTHLVMDNDKIHVGTSETKQQTSRSKSRLSPSLSPVLAQQAPRPKSRDSELQQQWRKLGREFGEKVGFSKQSARPTSNRHSQIER